MVNIIEGVVKHEQHGGLYTKPRIPHGVHVDSRHFTWMLPGFQAFSRYFLKTRGVHVDSRHFTRMLPGFQAFSRYFLEILFGREPQPNHTWSPPGFDLDFQVYCLHNTWKFQKLQGLQVPGLGKDWLESMYSACVEIITCITPYIDSV
jgi:hypothetical protein